MKKALSVMSLKRLTAAVFLFTFLISPWCGVAKTPDCGISFKALYVVSLRRPTVAFLLKPFSGVAKTPDRGISFKALYVVSVRRPTVAYSFSLSFQDVASDI